MNMCKDCASYFPVSEDEGDYTPGKADCIKQKEDSKGKYWTLTPLNETTKACSQFQRKI